MVKVILSVPEYVFPAKSVPETLAVAELTEVDTVQVKVQTEFELVAVINTLEITPDKLIVGVADILSEKVAVMVTTSELETMLSEFVSVKVTVGKVLSMVKVMLSVPEYALPDKSVPETVAVVEVTVVDTVQV